MSEKWLACPTCGDDGTYASRPSKPEPCKGCGGLHAVGRLEGSLQVIACRPPARKKPRLHGSKKRRQRKPSGVHGGKKKNTERLHRGRSVKR